MNISCERTTDSDKESERGGKRASCEQRAQETVGAQEGAEKERRNAGSSRAEHSPESSTPGPTIHQVGGENPKNLAGSPFQSKRDGHKHVGLMSSDSPRSSRASQEIQVRCITSLGQQTPGRDGYIARCTNRKLARREGAALAKTRPSQTPKRQIGAS